MTKSFKKLTAAKKNFKKCLDQKLQFTYPYASIKDVQATEKAFSSQKRTTPVAMEKIFQSVKYSLFFWTPL
jgi:hypothetical protein